ncbi:hypothetical protein Cgig2_025268 [Carnegiea gigantea]|uniref:Uncharacterized protein n=1 Tax=Carnegiea gigantea TaxID=171969 RepID=A0A9Q1QFM9_9CARY|nr:hypothetical protein Cgig2_025268 [Carnegiea gigantea]
MVVASSLQLSYEFGIYNAYGISNQAKVKDSWNIRFLSRPIDKRYCLSPKREAFQCRSIFLPGGNDFRLTKIVPVLLKRYLCLAIAAVDWSVADLQVSPGQRLVVIAAVILCRALDPVILPTEASQAIKQRLLHFLRSLSTVLAFAYCLSCLVQQIQKFFMEAGDYNDARNMGFQFAGKAIYTAVWVGSVSLFMELLGFSTQRWLTAGGLGTVLLTLAGREHVGWWSPTIIRGDDREALYIPNHKFTVSVVRNLSQKTHWRIKTHLAISHLDVNKINNIVADMRKVLSKNPQVEQQRLHRRVFLENINPDNQALLILISCFVKTSRFEEYLCVKEAILLDLLRVISHHRARLATPIRTIRKVYSDADADNIHFSETAFNGSRTASNHPFLLVDPSYKIYGDNKTKSSARPTRANEEKDEKSDETQKSEAKLDSKTDDQEKVDVNETGDSESDPGEKESQPSVPKRDEESPATPTKGRAALDDNIVLGVALDGSKRTLPIEEEMPTSSPTADSKELAAARNGVRSPSSTDDKKDDQHVNLGDNREKLSG